MSATGEFRLSITKALSDQLAAALDALTRDPLTGAALDVVESRGGVYQLHLAGTLVYIGKADRSLGQRLGQHLTKISGRLNISASDMTFAALYVDEDLSAVAPETLLIKRHRSTGEVPWNFNGFGNKDPGRQRDTSRVDATHFDALYPVNLDYPCEGIEAGRVTVGELLAALKRSLPWVFRYEAATKLPDEQPTEYRETTIDIPYDAPAAREVLTLLAAVMPGWQITVLPGYVIVYKESRTYPSARSVF